MHKDKKKGLITVGVVLAVMTGLIVTAFFGVGGGRLGVRNINQGLDLAGGVSIIYQADTDSATSAEVSSVVAMLRGRLDRRGYTEATVAVIGNYRLQEQIRFQVDIPGVEDANQAIQDIGRTALVTFHAPAHDGPGYVLFDGSRIISARNSAFQDEVRGVFNVVEFEFDAYATEVFADATRRYMGRSIYIMLDGEVISSPRVNAVIADGQGFIEGDFTPAGARELADLIRAGSLPFALDVMTWTGVGATLGEAALHASIISGIIGLSLILVFMVLFYKIAGLAANIALIIYLGLMLIIISGFGITLTLPGIAGLILSVAMAVDANIVIFERLKEELADGERSFRSAMDAAFKRSLTAIVDGNVTTFIAALILYALGTGPVMGFAVTLSVGIVVSMFTAIVVTRSILKAFYALGLNKREQYGLNNKLSTLDRLKDKPISIVESRRLHFIIPAVLLVISSVFMTVNGVADRGMFDYGVEFAGGTTMIADFGQVVDRDEISAVVEGITGDIPRVQSVGMAYGLQITMRETSPETLILLQNTFIGMFPHIDNGHFTTQDVSATVSGEMQRTAILAVLTAFGAMFVFIAFRFRNVKIAGAIIIKLLVNAVVLVGFYAIFRVTLNNSFIIAILTVLGYSTNDTIVLFDRLRENRKLRPNEDGGLLINLSVSQTMTRSVYTTATTLFAIICLIIFGVQSIREFAVPIMLGIVFGVYTSICLAGGVLHVFDKFRKKAKPTTTAA